MYIYILKKKLIFHFYLGPFKLAAYGVKQGGIGSILAGGMHLRKKSGGSNNRTSIAEEEHSGGPSPTEQKV